jgi:hypothetical protein
MFSVPDTGEPLTMAHHFAIIPLPDDRSRMGQHMQRHPIGWGAEVVGVAMVGAV